MVNTCKSYITDEGVTKIWDQPRDTLSKKIHDCIQLNNSYQNAFQRTKKNTEGTPGDKPFELSEMYMFGKFEIYKQSKITQHTTIYSGLLYITSVILKCVNQSVTSKPLQFLNSGPNILI